MEEDRDPHRRQYYPPQMSPDDEQGHSPAYPPNARRVTMPEPELGYQTSFRPQQHEYSQFLPTVTPTFPQPQHFGPPNHPMLPTVQADNSPYSYGPVESIPSHVSSTRSQTVWQPPPPPITGRRVLGRQADRAGYYHSRPLRYNPPVQGSYTWDTRPVGQQVDQHGEEWHSPPSDNFAYERGLQHPLQHQYHHAETSITQPQRISTSNSFFQHDRPSPTNLDISDLQCGRSQRSQSPEFVAEPEQYTEGGTTMFPELTRKAVLIGIDYKHKDYLQKDSDNKLRWTLGGCIHDVERLVPFLNFEGNYPMENIVMLTDNSQDPAKLPTKENILHWMKWLVEGAKEGDRLFFHFSGHGMQVPDIDGDEYDDQMDEVIIPLDFNFKLKKGYIVDDELNAIMVRPLPKGCRLTAIIDACHSGTSLDLQYTYDYSPESGFYLLDGPRRPDRSSEGDVILLSGCQDAQTSMDRSWGRTSSGAMTDAFLNSMHSFKHTNPTIRELITDIRRRVRERRLDQIPQLSSSKEVNLGDPFIF